LPARQEMAAVPPANCNMGRLPTRRSSHVKGVPKILWGHWADIADTGGTTDATYCEALGFAPQIVRGGANRRCTTVGPRPVDRRSHRPNLLQRRKRRHWDNFAGLSVNCIRQCTNGFCARIRETANWRRIGRFALSGLVALEIPTHQVDLRHRPDGNSAVSERLEYWNSGIVRGLLVV
jgi:hypothetical protein